MIIFSSVIPICNEHTPSLKTERKSKQLIEFSKNENENMQVFFGAGAKKKREVNLPLLFLVI
jgi:hypothetical protein